MQFAGALPDSTHSVFVLLKRELSWTGLFGVPLFSSRQVMGMELPGAELVLIAVGPS